MLAVISRIASDPSTDVDKLERLMAMYERGEARRAETTFGVAMSEAQSSMGRISADGNNPQTRSKYATYGKLDRELRPIYTAHGFALSFDTGDSPNADCIRVLCHVSHKEGHSRTYHIDMPADGKGAKGGDVMTKTHAAGAALSYGMRYLLKMIFNVAIGEDDDDGNGAGASVDDAVANPIYDKIELSAALPELEALKQAIKDASVKDSTRKNLIAAYNAKLRKLKGGEK